MKIHNETDQNCSAHSTDLSVERVDLLLRGGPHGAGPPPGGTGVGLHVTRQHQQHRGQAPAVKGWRQTVQSQPSCPSRDRINRTIAIHFH